VRPDRAYRGVKKESDVADGEPRDRADFLVAQAALKFQIDDFALVGRQHLDRREHLRESLARVVAGIEVGGHRDVGCVQRPEAPGLFPGVDREIAADREQPGRHPSVEPLVIFAAQPEERFLDDVAGGLEVAEQPLRVTKEPPFIKCQRLDHPVR